MTARSLRLLAAALLWAGSSPAVRAEPKAPACDIDDDCGAKELCVASKCVAITPRLAECQAASAHFAYRSAALRAVDRGALLREARCLKALPEESVLVAGNCDASGSVAYDALLGLRRAHAVARYLASVGVPESRITEVSYGKELGLCKEPTAACRAMNRRVDVALGAKPASVAGLIRADEQREHAVKAARPGKAPMAAAPGHRGRIATQATRQLKPRLPSSGRVPSTPGP